MEQTLVYEKSNFNYKLVYEVSKYIVKSTIKIGLIGCIFYNTYLSIQTYNQKSMTPIRIESKQSLDMRRTKEALIYLKAPLKQIEILTESIIHGASIAKVDPVLIAVLMKTESEFKSTAKSSMGYKSLMQTPTSTGLSATDTMHGCEILKEKLMITKNDIPKALTLYKGSGWSIKNGVKSKGYEQALQVLSIYKKVIDKVSIV